MKYLTVAMPGRAFLPAALGVALALQFSTFTSQAQGNLFSETFEGYTSFPSQIPTGDYVNPGIPQISEGADEFWYAARFQSGNGTIDSDLAVQKVGGGSNNTHVGRFEDDAGIVLRVDTTGYANVNLSFSWRTFLAETVDRITVGYHVGDNLGFDTGANRYLSLLSGPGSWTSGWTQLLSASASDSWHSQSYALPSNAGPIYVAFWMNDGEGDYGKVDNIKVNGTLLIPEPGTLSLLILGGATARLIRRRHRH